MPTKDYESVVASLQDATVECGLDTRPIINKLESRLTPPTFVPTTAFTSGFQGLVNTYGTPRYREANPGAFCCIFFPFLFGIMFGDFGHGSLLALFGYWLISKEKDWGDGAGLNDMVQMCYGGRYIILLNGIFGAYVGLLYNEAFAFPMNFFGGSRWYNAEDPSLGCFVGEDGGLPTCALDSPYPLGIDPIWHYTANKITFFNSFKMKISIIVGVIQMSVGICLSLLNHIEYKDWKRIAFEYIPEMVFFEGIFGYLVFCIFYKWGVDWNGDVGVPGNPGPQPAPSLLTLLINMFMSPTSDITVPLYGAQCFVDCGAAQAAGACGIQVIAAACDTTCGIGAIADTLRAEDTAGPEYKICFSTFQLNVQFGLLIAAFVAVPFLLFPIPFIELAEHKAEMAKKAQYEALTDEKGADDKKEEDEDGGFSFGDAFIHQAIHTIEFVLGSISNTASYLRLWALSLAHSQLAELFKDMVLTDLGLKLGLPKFWQGVVLFIAFGAWAIISLVVLMVMENLSSFLHALRLQVCASAATSPTHAHTRTHTFHGLLTPDCDLLTPSSTPSASSGSSSKTSFTMATAKSTRPSPSRTSWLPTPRRLKSGGRRARVGRPRQRERHPRRLSPFSELRSARRDVAVCVGHTRPMGYRGTVKSPHVSSWLLRNADNVEARPVYDRNPTG